MFDSRDYWSTMPQYQNVENPFVKYPNSDSYAQASWISGLENMLTGNLDYQRELSMTNANMAYNSMEADKERYWSQQMRDTSYISQINQYKAMGLNPYLSLGGGGASAPNGPTASANGSHRPSSGSAFSSLFSSMLGSAVNMANAEMNRQASLDKLAVSRNSAEAIAKDRIVSNERIARERMKSNEYINRNNINAREKLDEIHRKYNASRDWMRYGKKYLNTNGKFDVQALLNILDDFFDADMW